MFSLDKLKDTSKIYILGLINRHNNYNYTQIDYFDIKYNNEIFNPFIDKLIDLKQPIYQCKYIDWYSCIQQYNNTKYKKYFTEWINEFNNNANNLNEIIYQTGKLSKSYKNRNDYLTISILYDIYNIDYLKSIYNEIPINLFNYLKDEVYIYELPADTKKYIMFNDYIHSLEKSEIKEINETLMINKLYTKELTINAIKLNDRMSYLYKKYT